MIDLTWKQFKAMIDAELKAEGYSEDIRVGSINLSTNQPGFIHKNLTANNVEISTYTHGVLYVDWKPDEANIRKKLIGSNNG